MSDKKAKYILTRAIRGAEVQEVGSVIELTEAQAKHPLYRKRARKADLVVAEDEQGKRTARKQDDK